MSNLIGFDKLFDSGSFDKGTQQLAKFLERITDEITKAEIAADDLTKALGTKLKQQIQGLASSSATLARDIQNINNQMNQFQQTTLATQQVISNYQRENARLTAELNRLQNAQTQINNTARSSGVSFGQLSQSLLGVATGAAIVHQGIQTLKTQIILAVQSTIEFEQVMKEVQAVSGATSEELALLTANANKLGATTEKTAQQIAEAQKELAKLGFTTPEILLATKAIVDLSTATQEDLVKSAEVAAATVRSFGLDVDQLGRVTDVMTKSFIISALDLEKFRESMKLVAPIAASTNVEIEAVTAALAKLSDTGISGSLSGTALRNLLSSMADPTEKLVKFIGQYDETLKDGIKSSEDFTRALNVLKKSNIDLETAVSMVDVRARSAFFTLVEYAEDVEYLALELKYLDGETSKVAETMRDTLANDIKIAASAFDSLRRNLVEDSIPAMRTAVQETTQIIEFIRLAKREVDEFTNSINDNAEELGFWGVMLEIAKSQLGVFFSIFDFGIEKIDTFVENFNDIKKSEEVFSNMSTNVGKIVDDFIALDAGVNAHILASAELAKGTNFSAESMEKLRSQFTKLSHVTDDTDFLKLIIGQTKDQIRTADGYITALQGQEDELEKLIEALRKEAKEKGLNTEKTNILRQAESSLIVIRNLRFGQEEKLLEIKNKLGVKDAQQIKDLKDLYEAEKKLIDLRGQLAGIYAKIEEERAKAATQEDADLITKLVRLDKYQKARLNTLNQQLQAELDGIKYSELSEEESALKKEIAYAKHKQQKLNIDRDYYKEVEKLREEDIQKTVSQGIKETGVMQKETKAQKEGIIDAFNFFKKKSDERYDKFVENEKAQTDFSWEQDQEDKDNQRKVEEERLENLKKYAEIAADALINISRSFFDNRQIQRDNEMRAVDEWEQERVRMAGDNEEAILAIEKEANEKRAEIKKKQAQDDKKEAIFQIFIRTAMGVMGALASLPPNPVLAAIIGAAGALQMAAVATRPLPQFAKGTDNSPEGFAEVGERGRELVRDGRTGKWGITPDKSTVTYLTKGSQVIPNAQTEMILKNDPNVLADNYLKNKVVQVNTPQIDYNKIGEQFDRSISKIPLNKTVFDERGVTNYVIKRSSVVKRLNKRY